MVFILLKFWSRVPGDPGRCATAGEGCLVACWSPTVCVALRLQIGDSCGLARHMRGHLLPERGIQIAAIGCGKLVASNDSGHAHPPHALPSLAAQLCSYPYWCPSNDAPGMQ